MRKTARLILGTITVFCGLFVADLLSAMLNTFLAPMLEDFEISVIAYILLALARIFEFGIILYIVMKLLDRIHLLCFDAEKKTLFELAGILGTLLFCVFGFFVSSYFGGAMIGGILGALVSFALIILICNAIVDRISPRGTNPVKYVKWIVVAVLILILSTQQMDTAGYYYAGFLVILLMSAEEYRITKPKHQSTEPALPTEQNSNIEVNEAKSIPYEDSNIVTCDVCKIDSSTTHPHIDEVIQIEKSPAPVQTENAKAKKRFCKFCGGEVNMKTHQCMVCGKSTNLVARTFTGKHVKSMIIILLIFVLIGTNAYQLYSNKLLSDTLDDTNEQLRITRTKLNTYVSKCSKLEAKANFMDKHIVFVPNNGTRTYHRYDCEEWEGYSFWAFNTEAAVDDYKPCKKCID